MTALIPGQPAPSRPPFNISAARIASRTEDNLDENSKTYRDAFVREYIKDFHITSAMYRLGFVGKKQAAAKRGGELIREPYVANKIYDTIRVLQPSDIVARGQVMAGLLKEAYTAFLDSTRVQAWAHLGRMLGMDRPEKDTSSEPVGVMLVPCMRADDWEASSAVAQALLKKQVTQG